MNRTLKRIFDFFSKPEALVYALILGGVVGIYFPETSRSLAFIGNGFSILINLFILPIIFTAVSINFVELLKYDFDIIRKFSSSLFILLTICSALGLVAGILIQPGKNFSSLPPTILDVEIRHDNKGKDAVNLYEEFELNESLSNQHDLHFKALLKQSIPSNIFKSIFNNNLFHVVIFALLFAWGISRAEKEHTGKIIPIFKAIYQIFDKAFMAVFSILPIAVFSLSANSLASIGPGILMSLSKLIIANYIVAFIVYGIATAIIAIKKKTSFINIAKKQRRPVLIAIGTSSTIAAIPPLTKSLINNLGVSIAKARVLSPLSVIFGRYADAFYFSLTSIFIAQVFGVTLDVSTYIFIFIMSTIAAFSTSGTSGSFNVPMLSILLAPLDLPFEGIVLILYAIDPITDLVGTGTSIQMSCSHIFLTIQKKRRKKNVKVA